MTGERLSRKSDTTQFQVCVCVCVCVCVFVEVIPWKWTTTCNVFTKLNNCTAKLNFFSKHHPDFCCICFLFYLSSLFSIFLCCLLTVIISVASDWLQCGSTFLVLGKERQTTLQKVEVCYPAELDILVLIMFICLESLSNVDVWHWLRHF